MEKNIHVFEMLRAGLMAALTGVLAWVQIPLPFSPVPITGQTFGVMLAVPFGGQNRFYQYAIIFTSRDSGSASICRCQGRIGVLLGPRGIFGLSLAAYIIGHIACPPKGLGANADGLGKFNWGYFSYLHNGNYTTCLGC